MRKLTHIADEFYKQQSSGGLIDKDVMLLSRVAYDQNTAQFVSFLPRTEENTNLMVRYIAVVGYQDDNPEMAPDEAIAMVLKNSGEGKVNIRSFKKDQHQGNPFIMGLSDVEQILEQVHRLTGEGYHVIVHESVDVNDGGINCVYSYGYVECVAGATPRGMENHPDAPAVFSRDDFRQFILTVYRIELPYAPFTETHQDMDKRVEFSIHPKRRGVLQSRIIIWEISLTDVYDFDRKKILKSQQYKWPNTISKFIGDKVFGLMQVDGIFDFDHAGEFDDGVRITDPRIRIPLTTVFNKNKAVPVFQFGSPTGSGTTWTRTCPKTQIPGKLPTFSYWVNPQLLLKNDPEDELASCIMQDGVEARISGAGMITTDGNLKIEGVHGFGDMFMSGEKCPTFSYVLTTPERSNRHVPMQISFDRTQGLAEVEKRALSDIQYFWELMLGHFAKANTTFGMRFEWAHDGEGLWILQFHLETPSSSATVIYEGEPKNGWVSFESTMSLEYLRSLVATAKENEQGIKIYGNIGITSHVADVCRKAQVPTVIE